MSLKRVISAFLAILIIASIVPALGEEEAVVLLLGGNDFLLEGGYTYRSENPEIATVSMDGAVTPVAVGTGEITILDDTFTETERVFVEVKNAQPYFANTVLKLQPGESADNPVYTENDFFNTYSVTYESSNLGIAGVDEYGTVTAVSLGTAEISATVAGKYTASCTVNVVRKISDLQISLTKSELRPGEETEASCSWLPENATATKIHFGTTDPQIASVDTNGRVTAIQPGICRVTATDEFGLTASAELTVIRDAEDVRFTSSKDSMNVGDRFVFAAEPMPADTTDKTVTFSVSDAKVLTIDPATGEAEGKSRGTAIVTAETQNGKKVTCTVTVIQQPQSVEISGNPAAMEAGDIVRLQASVLPEDANDRSVTWESDNPAVASVDENGNVTAVGGGFAVISAVASNGIRTGVEIQVIRHAENVVPLTDTIIIGQTQKVLLPVTVYPLDTTDKAVFWVSENPAIAEIDPITGKIVGKAKGTTIVTVTGEGGLQAAIAVKVVSKTKAVKSIKLNKTALGVYENHSYQLKTAFSPTTPASKAVKWISSDPEVATVSSKGKVVGHKAGTCTITAVSSSGVYAVCNVKVKERPVSKVKLSKTSISVGLEKSYQLKATISPSDAKHKELTWTSSNDSVAYVTPEGKVVAVSLGTCKIKATAHNGKYAVCSVKVVPNKVTKITLNQGKFTGYVGETYQLNADIKPLYATNKAVLWKSSNKKVATVSQEGLVTPLKAGTVKITCTARDGSKKSAYCTIVIKERRVTSFTIDNSDQEMPYGEKFAAQTTVLPENASYKTVTWTSSNPYVATVDSNGIVTARTAGTAVITGSVDKGRKKASFTVTVTSDSTAAYRMVVIGEFTTKGQKGYLTFSKNGVAGVRDAFARSGIYGVGYKTAYNASNPSKAKIFSTIQSTFADADDDDVSVVYILTHGVQKNGTYYMHTSSTGKNMIAAKELINVLKDIPGNVLLVCCTCHSGGFIDNYTAPEPEGDSTMGLQYAASEANQYCTNGDGEPKFSVICSSSADTRSSYHYTTTEKKSYDFFTRAFTTGLGWNMISDSATGNLPADLNGDGKVTVAELASYSKSTTTSLINQYLSKASNKKNFHGSRAQTVTYYLPNPDLVIFGE